MKPISSLENIHSGEDIYIIAAGKSADFIDPDFLKGRITIGINQVYKRFTSLTYLVKKDGPTAADLKTGIPIIVSQLKYGNDVNNMNMGSYYFSHNINLDREIAINELHPNGDRIIVSFSTITSAMHLAAFMGARSIFLIGHDCRTIDGKASFKGYHGGIPDLWKSKGAYEDWLKVIEPQSIITKALIEKNYPGCRIYSINPFVSMRFEGHELGV